MPKIYIIYAKIPAILFNSKLYEYVSDQSKYELKNNMYIGLYAWSKNKKMINHFLQMRSSAKDIYTIVTKKMSHDDYQEFKLEHADEKIRFYPLARECVFHDTMDGYDNEDDYNDIVEKIGNSLSYTVVCTQCEFESVLNSGEQHLFEFMSQHINTDYLPFKSEYRYILDKLGYCDLFNIINNDEEDEYYSSRYEITENSASYGVSYYGNKYIDLFNNKLVIFVHIYYEMIFGYDKNREIKLLLYH